MHYWKTAFLTLLIFGLGGVAGSLITAQVIKGKIERVQISTLGPETARPEFIPQYLGALQRQMNLTPDQVQRIREILMRSQRETARARGVSPAVPQHHRAGRSGNHGTSHGRAEDAI